MAQTDSDMPIRQPKEWERLLWLDADRPENWHHGAIDAATQTTLLNPVPAGNNYKIKKTRWRSHHALDGTGTAAHPAAGSPGKDAVTNEAAHENEPDSLCLVVTVV